MRSRYLMELTTPEVEKFLESGNRTAFLPVGCVEMHGPHQPIGTDTFIAKAFAVKLAEQADGLVLPEVHYSWAGSTDGFKGTISIGMDLEQELVEAIVIRAFTMGFKHLIIVSAHGPNDQIIYLCARRIFDKYQKPVLFIDPYEPFNISSAEIFAGEYEKSKEASLVLASLNILGQPELYLEAEMCYEDNAPAYSPEQKRLQKIVGGIGYFMQDIRQHACPSRCVSLKKGLEFFESQIMHMNSIMADLDSYTAEVDLQKNKGWYGCAK